MKTGKFADFSNDVKFSGRELEGECGFQLDAPPHDSHFVVRFSQYCVIMNSNEVLGKNGRSSLLKWVLAISKGFLLNNANTPKAFRVVGIQSSK